MTGFDSKRQATQDKLQDDADTLTIVYAQGFADGKKAAQRKPLTIKDINTLPEAKGHWPIGMNDRIVRLIRAVEAAHNIKEGT
jgi:hypothetical protein